MPTHPSRPYPRLLNDPVTHHTTDVRRPYLVRPPLAPRESHRARGRVGAYPFTPRAALKPHTHRTSRPHTGLAPTPSQTPTLPSDGAAPPVPSAPLKPTHLDDVCLLRPSRRPRPPRRRQPCPAPLSCPFRRPSLPGPQP